jgi:hypothetical protein
MRLAMFFAGCFLLAACDAEGDKAAAASHGQGQAKPATPVSEAAPSQGVPAAPAPVPAALPGDDGKLRRKYGLADMKYNPCVKVQGATLQGRGCPATIVVFGPYSNVPANSEIEFVFEVQATSAVEVYSDMFAQVGKRALGSLVPQKLAPNEKRRFGYRVNMAAADTAVEARVWVHGTGPSDFEVSNLSMTVK